MDYIKLTFLLLAVGILILGLLLQYTRLFPDFVQRTFRYGRANVFTGGSIQKIEVPKRWFWHFYLWAVILQAFVVYTTISMYLTQDFKETWVSKILKILAGTNRSVKVNGVATVLAVVLFQFHVTRRLLETLFVSVYSDTKMNIFHYILAFVHYTFAILSLVAYSPGFASQTISKEDFDTSTFPLNAFQLFGIFTFFRGNYDQFLAHKTFADLRKGADKKTVTTMEHKIPTGGMFRYISCPNYWAEIMIYSSFGLVLNFQNSTWLCCTLWVICNQIISGLMNHAWYKEKFRDEYPQNRRAVIPFIL